MAARLIVVEDTPHTLQLMDYLLRAHGHTVAPYAEAEPAIEEARRDPPDLIVMDIQLTGGIDGFEALRRVRRSAGLAGTPVIAVTAFAMVGDREQALAAGFTDYLTKPIDPYSFAAEIDRSLPPALRGQATQPHTESPQSPPVVSQATTGPHILVVDDLPTNVDLMRSILESYGYRVSAADCVAAALAVAQTDRPDLVLSDIHIGTESGFELHRRLQGDPHLADVPFAFNTASADTLGGKTTGAIEVIRRPVEPGPLLDRVRELLGERPEGRDADDTGR